MKKLAFLIVISMFVIKPDLRAQGTSFTYQGRLNDGLNPANGSYDLRFVVYDNSPGGNQQGPALTNSATAVSNGLFTVSLNFGAIFTGTNYWLDISVRTNGNGVFVELLPRQPLTPAPYAIMANSASNLLGSLPTSQLGAGTAAINITGSAANVTGVFAGDVTGVQGATIVSTVGGVSSANLAAGANASNAASSTNSPNSIVKRDGTGSFSTASLTLASNLNLPATTATSGVIYSGPNTLIHVFGSENLFAGESAGNLTLTGGQNTGLGSFALSHDTSGSENTAHGNQALYFNTSGTANTADGYETLMNNSTGSNNIAVGSQSLYYVISGSANIGIGPGALPNLDTGSSNIAIGVFAGNAIFTGNNNIDIGNSGFGDESGVIRIGTAGLHTKAVMNGIYGTTVGSGAPVQVNANGLLGTLSSSRRFKQNIQSMAGASDVLLSLHPVTFQYKPELDPDCTPQFGLIAEDVEKVDPALVLHDDKHQIYTVRYEAVNAMLLNEFLKQHGKVQEQTDKIEHQESEIQDLKQNVADLKKLVQSLAGTK